jgi:hypothetical protein
MNYDVDWDAVEDDLANVWMTAADRAAVTAAVHRIDRQLQRDPSACGESRGRTNRLVFDGPVGVLFRVDAPNRVVVLAVGPSGRSR